MKKLFSIDRAALKWIWESLKLSKWALVLLILIQMVNGVFLTERSLLLKDVIDSATTGMKGPFVKNLFFMIGLFLLQLSIMSIYRHVSAKTQYGLEMHLKKKLYSTLLEKDYASVKAVHSGHWNQRMTSDTSTVASLSVNLIPNFIGLLVRIITALAALFVLMPLLVILLIPFGFCLLGATMFLKRTSKRMYNDIQDADGRFRVFFQEHINNLMMIRAFGKEEMSIKEGDRVMNDHKNAIIKRNSFMIFVSILASLAMNGMYILGVVLGGYGILKGSVTYGTFSAVLSLASQTQSQIAGVSSYLSNIFSLTASAERLMKPESFPDDERTNRPAGEILEYYKNDFSEIQLRNAAFSYLYEDEKEQSETKVFTDMNLHIKKGEFIALTGESGCGKSTILKILLSIYPLESGQCLLVGEHPNLEVPLDASWRGLFAYVPQGNCLMKGSIGDVISFGCDKDQKKLENAIQIACADQFISELENGLDTQLGEQGSGLSEGQMQRISIARAIYSDRPILLLDESTSALDTETEKRMLQNVRSMTDKTVIIVTHRPAALDVCNRVISFGEDGILKDDSI